MNIQIVILYVKGKVKGVVTEKEFIGMTKWWDNVKTLTVPEEDYLNGKITVGNVEQLYYLYT